MKSINKTFEENQACKVGCMVAAVMTLALFGTATVYLGIYGYNNPDPESCWVVRDLDTGFKTKLETEARAKAIEIDIAEGYPMEMHKVYLTWFLWGFWANMILIIMGCISFLISYASENIKKVLDFISCGLYVTNGAVWIAFGTVWRFSQPGQVAAGEKLARNADVSDDAWTKSVE